MTDQIREQISAFVDDELRADQVGLLVRRMERDEGLRTTFGQYVLVGETLRAPGGTIASPGFAARVMAAIDEQAEQIPDPTERQPQRRSWARPLLGAGLAASIAMLALLVVNSDREADVQVAEAPADAQLDTGSEALIADAGVAPADLPQGSPTPAERQRLTGYFVAHGQFATPMGRRNVWSGVLADDPRISNVSYEVVETP